MWRVAWPQPLAPRQARPLGGQRGVHPMLCVGVRPGAGPGVHPGARAGESRPVGETQVSGRVPGQPLCGGPRRHGLGPRGAVSASSEGRIACCPWPACRAFEEAAVQTGRPPCTQRLPAAAGQCPGSAEAPDSAAARSSWLCAPSPGCPSARRSAPPSATGVGTGGSVGWVGPVSPGLASTGLRKELAGRSGRRAGAGLRSLLLFPVTCCVPAVGSDSPPAGPTRLRVCT